MADDVNITEERAAKRFRQIATLERQIQLLSSEIAECSEHLKELKDRRESYLDRLRLAARDEGELPLFDL
jgi:chromosome segregation ATPase